MIDINELRRLALDGDLAAMQAIIIRLERAEKGRDALRAALQHEADCVEAAKAKIADLRAEIAEMEKQEPVGQFIQHPSNGLWEQDGYGDNPDARPLYALPGASAFTVACFNASDVPVGTKLYLAPGAQQCKNCNGMGDRFDPSGEKIPCDLCESNFEEIRVLVAEAAHDIISGGDFWLSTSLAAKKIYALPGAQIKYDCGEAGHDEGRCGNRQCLPSVKGEEK